MVKPWADNGWKCVCFDLQHSIRRDRIEGNITYRWADVRSLTPADMPNPYIVFAFPPCTHLSVSGARDFKRKGMRLLIDALEVAESCRMLCEYSGEKWMLENPVSRLSSCWRDPDYYFDPCDYGDPYTKKTCIWAGRDFVMPPKRRVEPVNGSMMHLMPPSSERSSLRSATPPGFSMAVYQSNSVRLMREVLNNTGEQS